jgi:hypothetical protein
MSEQHQILLSLDKFLPIELTRTITYIYIIIGMTEQMLLMKPGDIVFNSPCGHRLKGFGECKYKILCSLNDTTYFFNSKKYYNNISTYANNLALDRLVEVDNNCELDKYFCELCKRFWAPTGARWSRLQSIVCFCNKTSYIFPCGDCPAKKCYHSTCSRVIDGTSTLCYRHSMM